MLFLMSWCCGFGMEGMGLGTYWEDDAEDVEDDVRHGVLRQRLHARVLDQATPQPTGEFDYYRACHDDDCR